MMVTPSVRLVRPLGQGGMGAGVGGPITPRFGPRSSSNSLRATSKTAKTRPSDFRAGGAAAQVKSPHVVQTFDHGVTTDGTPYIVMELLEGKDLGPVLEHEGKVPPNLVIELVVQLARALDRAHERSIIHRDIKPGNIFLCDSGRGEVFS